MNKSETILLFQRLMLELEHVKKMQLELKTQIQEARRISINNQVIIDKKLNQLLEKI